MSEAPATEGDELLPQKEEKQSLPRFLLTNHGLTAACFTDDDEELACCPCISDSGLDRRDRIWMLLVGIAASVLWGSHFGAGVVAVVGWCVVYSPVLCVARCLLRSSALSAANTALPGPVRVQELLLAVSVAVAVWREMHGPNGFNAACIVFAWAQVSDVGWLIFRFLFLRTCCPCCFPREKADV